MKYRILLSATALLALTACGSLGQPPQYAEDDPAVQARRQQIVDTAPHPNFVGTEEWYAWVDSATGVVDAEGRGPAHGSTEWCHAVHRSVTGFDADETVPCDRTWERQIDRTLRTPRSILDVL